MSKEAMDFLMGGGVPSAKFETIGTVHKGRVISMEMSQVTDIKTGDLKTWPDGNPQMQAIITLQTEEQDPEIEDDDGKRRVFARNNMRAAIRDAIKASKLKGQSIVGGVLAVKYVSDGKRAPGQNPPKQYEAKFTAPSPTDIDPGSPEHDERNPLPSDW